MLAPLIRGQKGEYRDLFADLLKQGFVRARVDGRVVRLSDDLRLDRQMRHNIEVVIDRLVVGPKIRPRLAEAVELALRLGEGNLIVARRRKRGRRRRERRSSRAGSGVEAQKIADDPNRRRKSAIAPLRSARSPDLYSLRPLRLHALQSELRAAQPAAVQLQQSAGHVPRVQRAWARSTASIPSG